MVCTTPTLFAPPFASTMQAWANGVEMQMALSRAWVDIARIYNPMLPEFDMSKRARPHGKPAPKPAAGKARPAPRRADPAAKPAARRHRKPAKPDQPFKV